MKIQSIGQNNYNCQNRQNQPAFGASVLCEIQSWQGNDVVAKADIVASGLMDLFKKLLAENGIELPKNMLGNKITYWCSRKKDCGVFIALDKDAPGIKRTLDTVPDTKKLFDSPEIGQMLDNSATFCDEVALHIADSDTETLKFVTWQEVLEDYGKGLESASTVLTRVTP
jgi:hypothetical protein